MYLMWSHSFNNNFELLFQYIDKDIRDKFINEVTQKIKEIRDVFKLLRKVVINYDKNIILLSYKNYKEDIMTFSDNNMGKMIHRKKDKIIAANIFTDDCYIYCTSNENSDIILFSFDNKTIKKTLNHKDDIIIKYEINNNTIKIKRKNDGITYYYNNVPHQYNSYDTIDLILNNDKDEYKRFVKPEHF